MTATEQSAQDEVYPPWEPTDWTPRQRTVAIVSLLLLAFSCALIAGALARWGTDLIAQMIYVPIGMTLFTVSIALLASVYWYGRKHAYNSVGENAATTSGPYFMLYLVGVVGVVSLALEVVGSALMWMAGWTGWRAYGSVSYLLPSALFFLLAVLLGMTSSTWQWRPTRNPAAPDSTLSAPVTGARLGLRWVLMLVAQNPWAPIGGAMYALNTWGTSLSPHTQSGLFAVGGAFFLLAALSELTHRA